MENRTDIFNPDDLLENLMGDKEMCVTILEGFLIDLPEQIKKLEQAVSDNDEKLVERQAHTIKGACGNIGGQELQEAAYTLERLGKEGDIESVKKQLPEFSKKYQVLSEMVERRILEWQP